MDNIIQDDTIIEIPEESGVTTVKKTEKRKKRRRCPGCNELYHEHEMQSHGCSVEDGVEKVNKVEKVSQLENLTQEERLKVIELGGQSLFDLQMTLYVVMNNCANISGSGILEGLPQKFAEKQEVYKGVYESIYREYGEDIGQYIGPITAWAILTSNDIGTTIIENKKKASQN